MLINKKYSLISLGLLAKYKPATSILNEYLINKNASYINLLQDFYLIFKNLNITSLEAIYEIYIKILSNMDNDNNCLHFVFEYYLNNDTLLSIKNYYKYYNNQNLVNWIINLSNLQQSDNTKNILDGNVKVNSFIELIYKKFNNFKNCTGYQSFDIINKLCNLNINIFYDDKFILLNNNILTDGLNNNYDYIFFDFPTGIHNITHAACCKKIKQLQIRGTKFDSLLLQLIMMSLNKNGDAFLIIPNSLLFCTSIQQIQTRKYLIDNFNIIKIIEIDEKFYKIKGVKNSILYFKNNGKTNNIIFSKLYENMNEEIIYNIDYNKIINANYSLFYKHYSNIINTNILYMIVSDKCKIYNDFNNNFINDNILSINKYYKNDNSIYLGINNKSNYYIESNDTYVLHYIYNSIKLYPNLYTFGKLLKFDINKIKEIKIPILSDTQHKMIINYINISNNIITTNNNKIDMYKKLNNCLLSTLYEGNELLINICNIVTKYENNLIGIIKNGLSAGLVYINDTNELHLNSYYLKLNNENYNFHYIYYYLKYIEPTIQENCKLYNQPLLIKSYLDSIKIPNITKSLQDDIILQCKEYEENINKYLLDNNNIKNKNIIDIILKLY